MQAVATIGGTDERQQAQRADSGHSPDLSLAGGDSRLDTGYGSFLETTIGKRKSPAAARPFFETALGNQKSSDICISLTRERICHCAL